MEFRVNAEENERLPESYLQPGMDNKEEPSNYKPSPLLFYKLFLTLLFLIR